MDLCGVQMGSQDAAWRTTATSVRIAESSGTSEFLKEEKLMCTYCMIGDWTFRHDPPFIPVPGIPYVPSPLPLSPSWQPWPLDKLQEYLDLLERVKKLEDALGCPCEPNKADYIGILKKRIEALEKRVAEKKTP